MKASSNKKTTKKDAALGEGTAFLLGLVVGRVFTFNDENLEQRLGNKRSEALAHTLAYSPHAENIFKNIMKKYRLKWIHLNKTKKTDL